MNNIEPTTSLEQLKTIEGTKTFFNNIPEEYKKNLLMVLNNIEIPRQYRIIVTVSGRWEYHSVNYGLNTMWSPKEDMSFPITSDNSYAEKLIKKAGFTEDDAAKIRSWELTLAEAINTIKHLTEHCNIWEEEWMTPFSKSGRYIGGDNLGEIKVHNTFDYELSPGQK